MAKQRINIEGLTAEKSMQMLGNFNYPLEVDKKGRLRITGDIIHAFISFKNKGNVTEVKLASLRWVSLAKVMFIPFYWIYANLAAMSERNKLFNDFVRGIQNPQTATVSTNTITEKLQELKTMKDNGLITEEEFNAKKADLIKNL